MAKGDEFALFSKLEGTICRLNFPDPWEFGGIYGEIQYGTPVASRPRPFKYSAMIEALFNQTNYIAAKTGLDATHLKHQAIASNLANAKTPGYRRVDTAPSFQEAFNQALKSGDKNELKGVKPTIDIDETAISNKEDGNSVDIEHEIVQLNQTALAHKLQTQLISGTLSKLRLAITGRPH